MKSFIVYTDGSFGDTREVHGGIVYWGADGPTSMIHVKSSLPQFVSMRNVGGEVIAAWSAIMSIANMVKDLNEKEMETYTLNIVYDYEGVGKWLTGAWRTNKPATQWFVKSVRDILSQVPNLSIKYIWVKGHDNTRGNEYADRVASYTMDYCELHEIPICNLDEVINI
jgi:ribonuclease HI